MSLALLVMCSGVVLTPGNVDVVLEKDAPSVTRVAAAEMTNFLSRVLGAPVPLADRIEDGRTSVILGLNDWSRAAGVDVADAPRDTFAVRAEGNRIYIAGRDDPEFDLARALRNRAGYGIFFTFERATLHGVYDFLERYAGVRFYFPDDELGTVVPRKERIAVPEGTRTVTPDFLIRDPYFGGDGKWPFESYAGTDVKTGLRMRHRLASTTIPCCHGSQCFRYIERFGKTRPEYLALKRDGSRWLDPKVFAPYQLCWTNPGLRETMYQDIKAYLTGQPASSRGLPRWEVNCRFGKWVDIMPDDSFQGCFCKDCQAAYRHVPGDRDYATEMMWGLTAEFGNRLIREGVPGNITMMAYPPYRRIPDFALPTNVYVMVAETGPWSMTDPSSVRAQYDEIRGWARKLGHKVWIWTYPRSTAGKGVPSVAPHAWCAYYTALKDDILGTFAECETGRSIFNFLNYYCFSRVMWDASADVDAILDELYADLFGAAKGEMKAFFSVLEEKWTKGVVGRIVDTPLGPKMVYPDTRTLWTEVYSPALRAELDALLKSAEAKVVAGSLESRRIALMRREFYDAILAGAADYENLMNGVEGLRRKASEGRFAISAASNARGVYHGAAKVRTTVAVKRTAERLEVGFSCEEPTMDIASCPHRKNGDPETWQDNAVELQVNPSGDRRTVCHVILTSAGTVACHRFVAASGLPHDWSAIEGLETGTKRTADGWEARIAIPLAALPGLKDACPMNFCRHRVLTDGTEERIVWSPYVKGFVDVEHYGTMEF